MFLLFCNSCLLVHLVLASITLKGHLHVYLLVDPYVASAAPNAEYLSSFSRMYYPGYHLFFTPPYIGHIFNNYASSDSIKIRAGRGLERESIVHFEN